MWPSMPSAEQTEGLHAYALRQASIRHDIRVRCEFVWRYTDEWVALAAVDDADEPVIEEPLDEDSDED